MVDTSRQLIEALEAFEALASHGTLDDVHVELDETALQIFWRQWPEISSWAGSLWRRVNQDLAEPASPESAGMADIGGNG